MFITPGGGDRLVAPVELRMRYTVDGRLGVRAEYKIDKEGDWGDDGAGLRQAPPPYCPPPWGFSSFTGMDSIPELEGRGDRAGRPRPYPPPTAEAYGKELSVTPRPRRRRSPRYP